jgi:hypothetical protein
MGLALAVSHSYKYLFMLNLFINQTNSFIFDRTSGFMSVNCQEVSKWRAIYAGRGIEDVSLRHLVIIIINNCIVCHIYNVVNYATLHIYN